MNFLNFIDNDKTPGKLKTLSTVTKENAEERARVKIDQLSDKKWDKNLHENLLRALHSHDILGSLNNMKIMPSSMAATKI
jgi:hypothetical protein